MNSNLLKYSMECPCNKKLSNVSQNDFYILKFNNYDELIVSNYKLSQLRQMCKFYKLKVSGNKKQLYNQLYNFLRLSFYANKIQKVFRGYLQRQYNKLHGPAFKNKKICTNLKDFYTLEEINLLPHYQFFSYKDSDGFIYGFDILSIYNLISKNATNQSVTNPFNRSVIEPNTINDLYKCISLTKLLKFPISINISNDYNRITPKKRAELRIITLFQKINEMGNYADSRWFTDLSYQRLLLFIRELSDIWNYRAELSEEIKIDICPPHGNPFHSITMVHLQNLSFSYLQNIIISIMESMVNINSTNNNKHLGSLYILSALCLVNPDAASALPWLFQSVAHSN